MPSKEKDLRKSFEAILGQDFDPDNVGDVVLRHRVAVNAIVEAASVTSRDIGTTGSSTKACSSNRAVDVGGTSQTRADGSVKLSLRDFYCRNSGVAFEYPINFVATPQGQTPAFLTSLQRVVSNASDVEITVFSWNANGKPLKNVGFDWRCIVPYDFTVD